MECVPGEENVVAGVGVVMGEITETGNGYLPLVKEDECAAETEKRSDLVCPDVCVASSGNVGVASSGSVGVASGGSEIVAGSRGVGEASMSESVGGEDTVSGVSAENRSSISGREENADTENTKGMESEAIQLESGRKIDRVEITKLCDGDEPRGVDQDDQVRMFHS